MPEKNEITNQNLANSIDELAVMVNNGFNHVQKQFDVVNKQFDVVNKQFGTVNKQFDGFNKEFNEFKEDNQKEHNTIINSLDNITTIQKAEINRQDKLEARVVKLEKRPA